jgi:hypothetical protein
MPKQTKSGSKPAVKKPPSIRKCDKCGSTKLTEAFKAGHLVCRQCEDEAEVEQEWIAAIRPPRVLLIDLETAPSLAYVWRNWDASVLATEREWFVLSFAYRWLGEGRTQVVALPDFPETYATNKEDDSRLIEELWKLLDASDFVCGHNLDRFDIRKANSRAIIAGLQPPSPYKTIDTLKIARKYFAFASNKLNDLGVVLGLGEKVKHGGFQLWMDCMTGDKKAWAEMRAYNRQDVDLLEAVYLKLRPWHSTHPSFDHFSRLDACPICQSTHLQRRGRRRTRTTMRQQYRCEDCGHWSVDARSVRIVD